MTSYKHLSIDVTNQGIAIITLNRKEKCNALNQTLFDELKKIYLWIEEQKNIKICILHGAGKHFTTGIDLEFLKEIYNEVSLASLENQSPLLFEKITHMQDSFSAIANCSKPTIAAIHGYCIGGGVDLIAACDIRLACLKSYFSIMETKLGIVADLGTLQRLPTIISDGHLRELSYSSRIFTALHAKKINLLNGVYWTKKGLFKKAMALAESICALPPYAVAATKATISYSQNHSTEESLKQVAKLNSKILLSEEAKDAFKKIATKK